MSKDLTFRVELTFSGKIVSDDEVMEIAQKIANSLEHEVNTGGLAPEDSDIFTEHIRVTPQYVNKTIIVSF
jgi:hypothetical protein